MNFAFMTRNNQQMRKTWRKFASVGLFSHDFEHLRPVIKFGVYSTSRVFKRVYVVAKGENHQTTFLYD